MADDRILIQHCRQLNERQETQVLAILTECDSEFVPPLSSRESTTQTSFSPSSENMPSKVPITYFEQMKRQEFLLAVMGDSVVGFMSFTPAREMIVGGIQLTTLYLSTIAVGRQYRKRGIARLCYDYLIQRFGQNNIVTRTWSGNEGHIHLLHTLGFTLLEKIENDRGNGIHTVYYGRLTEDEE